MLESVPSPQALADRLFRPLAWLLHRGLGLSPDQVSLASCLVSIAAGVAIGDGRLGAGLWLMFAGQVLDAVDGAIAREYGLMSPQGGRVDTFFDRVSEAAIFVGFAYSGLAPVRLVILALAAIMLLTTLVERTGVDPGFKRTVLYFGRWLPYSSLFTMIFAVNLAGFVVSLLRADIQFQNRMDALGGDLDTVASRAAALETAERRSETVSRTA